MKKSLITILLLLVALAAALKVKDFVRNNRPEPTSTNIEPVPTDTASITPSDTSEPSQESKVTVALNEPFAVNGTLMVVKSVLEDSRCPSDVTCIWAGKVTIELAIASSTSAQMEPGENISNDDFSLTLDSVTPYPLTSTHQTGDAEYRFTFTAQAK